MDENSLFTPYDEAIQTKELQILKSIFPYTKGSTQRQLALIIQLIQLEKAMHIMNSANNMLSAMDVEDKFCSQAAMLNSIKRFCNDKEIETIDTIINVMTIMNQE